MNIKILSDSTCDLPADLLKQHNITLVPLTVIKGDEQIKDGVTITPAEIFEHVAKGGSLCTTAANSVGEYKEFFDRYCPDYDGVIVINIGSHFSACYQNACIAAADYDNVRVIDSANLSSGQGHVVLKACELAADCTDLDRLADELRDYTTKVEASFLLDRLDYMVKGGRCSSAAALGAHLLNLKPCIEVKDGKMSVVKKYRGNDSKCLATYVSDRLTNREDIDRTRIFITSTVVPAETYEAVTEKVNAVGGFRDVLHSTAGCTVSCHCGPGTLGILFVRK